MTDPLRCPTCGSGMAPEARAGIVLDRCPVCGTVWCDRTELAAVVAAERPGALLGWGRRRPGDAARATPRCPRDPGAGLEPWDLDGVPFRRCPTCRGIAIAGEDLQRLLLQAGKPADHR